MLDPYTPTRIPDGVTVHWDGTADDTGWSAYSPALQVGTADIENPRGVRVIELDPLETLLDGMVEP